MFHVKQNENKYLYSTVCEVFPDWKVSDYLGAVGCRISNYFRMKYKIEPGLYRLGRPDENSEVLVSANYKLSFNILRKSLKGLNAWILVLDTKGINVWCAAGKGTFGTEELVNQINDAGLGRFLKVNRVIVPQLGAVGVNGDAVFKITGIKVYFGPVYARDIKKYIEAGKKKTPEMRLVNFPIIDRIVLTPMELIPAFKKFILFAVFIFIFFGFQTKGIIFKNGWNQGRPFIILGILSIIAGSFITPVLLPYIPFRQFTVKGWIAGILTVSAFWFLAGSELQINFFVYSPAFLFFPFVSSYFALQFTGSTTYTGMSGVKKELKKAMPFYLISAAVFVVIMLAYKLKLLGLYN